MCPARSLGGPSRRCTAAPWGGASLTLDVMSKPPPTACEGEREVGERQQRNHAGNFPFVLLRSKTAAATQHDGPKRMHRTRARSPSALPPSAPHAPKGGDRDRPGPIGQPVKARHVLGLTRGAQQAGHEDGDRSRRHSHADPESAVRRGEGNDERQPPMWTKVSRMLVRTWMATKTTASMDIRRDEAPVVRIRANDASGSSSPDRGPWSG